MLFLLCGIGDNAGQGARNGHGEAGIVDVPDSPGAPRLRRARAGAEDRRPDRSDPDPGRHRHHGVPAVRGPRRAARAHRAFGELRRSQHAPDRFHERRRPPLPAIDRRQVRPALLAGRQRHLPPGAPRALRRAGQDPARLGQPHPDGRRPRDAGDGRGRPRRGAGDGRGTLHARPPPR